MTHQARVAAPFKVIQANILFVVFKTSFNAPSRERNLQQNLDCLSS